MEAEDMLKGDALTPDRIFLPKESNTRSTMLWLAGVAAISAGGVFYLAHRTPGVWSTVFYLLLAAAFYFLFLSPVVRLLDIHRSTGYAWTALILYTVLFLVFVVYGVLHVQDTGSLAISNLYFGEIGLFFVGVLLAYFAWRASLW